MIDRKTFLYSTFLAAAGSRLPFASRELPDEMSPANTSNGFSGSVNSPHIIDTHIHLFQWPFRKLKYSRTELLISKLRKHRILQAWAGSFEALFHKDLDAVNHRLAVECRNSGEGYLIPFGSVNVQWPGWRELLRRCDEEYRMPGIRIYPGYQGFDLGHSDFRRLMEMMAERQMILQIACDMEDSRVHHPLIEVRNSRIDLLPQLAADIPELNIQLLYWNHRVGQPLLEQLVSETEVVFDTTRIETCGGLGRLIEGNPWAGNATMKIPAERFLFGSHAPYFPVETNVLKLFESPLEFEQMKAVMMDNAKRIMEIRV